MAVPVALKTIRQQISEALKTGMLTTRDLSQTVGVKERDVFTHLPHVARSTLDPAVFVVEPSACLDCGFCFKKRTRLSTPGKCPVCRSERITETRYGIVDG